MSRLTGRCICRCTQRTAVTLQITVQIYGSRPSTASTQTLNSNPTLKTHNTEYIIHLNEHKKERRHTGCRHPCTQCPGQISASLHPGSRSGQKSNMVKHKVKHGQQPKSNTVMYGQMCQRVSWHGWAWQGRLVGHASHVQVLHVQTNS